MALVASGGCGDGTGSGVGDGGPGSDGSVGGGSGGGNGGGGNGGGSGGGSGGGNGGGGNGGGTGNGSPEVCNGVDDDGNGRIDDIDVGGDGICDCLNVGTLGLPGIYGGGGAFNTWLAAKGSLVRDVGGDELTDDLLAGLDVLIVNDVTNDGYDYDPNDPDDHPHGIGRDYSPEEVAALQRFVKAGGGIITLIGYWSGDQEVVNVNRLLAPYSMSYQATAYLGGLGPVGGWDNNMTTGHPVAQGITSVGADNGYQPLGTGDRICWETRTEEEETVCLAQSGTSAVGTGKVFVFGDEWVTYDALWTGEQGEDYQIEQFWINVMNWLTPAEACEIDIVIGGS